MCFILTSFTINSNSGRELPAVPFPLWPMPYRCGNSRRAVPGPSRNECFPLCRRRCPNTKGPPNKSRGPILPVSTSGEPPLAAFFLGSLLLGSGLPGRLLRLGRLVRGFFRRFFRRLLGRGFLRGCLRSLLFRRLFLALFVGFFFHHEDFFFFLGNALAVPA